MSTSKLYVYNPGQRAPFRYHVYAPKAPATRRHYKPQTFQAVTLGQREWPYVYPKHIGTIPLAVYGAYERLPMQRTAELSRLALPPSKDGNPHAFDTATEARIRNKIINTYVQYSPFEAEAVVDNVNVEVSVAAAFGRRAWGGSGNADEHWRYFFVAAANPSAPGHLLVPRGPAGQPVSSSTVEDTAVQRAYTNVCWRRWCKR